MLMRESINDVCLTCSGVGGAECQQVSHSDDRQEAMTLSLQLQDPEP